MNMLLFLAGLLLAAVIINIPLGYFRQAVEKFSFAWYFYVHISIPLILYLRTKAGFSWRFIPLTILAAVLGQIIGGRLRRKSDAGG